MDIDNNKRKRYIKKLMMFLAKKGVLLNFLDNYNKYSIYNGIGCKKMSLTTFLMREHPINFFINSFTWSYTPESRTFWSDLHDEWIKNFSDTQIF